MDFNIIKEYFLSYQNTIGLACNFAGTLFIFFAYAKDENEWVEGEEGMKPGEKRYATVIKHPCFLKVGIALISFGFFLIVTGE